MNSILLDTSILIESQTNLAFRNILQVIQVDAYISRVTACEVIMGSRNSKEKKDNRELIEVMSVIELDKEVSKLAYDLIDRFGLRTKLNVPDALIAATALVHGRKLWTLNLKHFRLIPELDIYQVK